MTGLASYLQVEARPTIDWPEDAFDIRRDGRIRPGIFQTRCEVIALPMRNNLVWVIYKKRKQ